MALSPISPQELFLEPMSSDVDTSQQNLVRQRTNIIVKHKTLSPWQAFWQCSDLLIYVVFDSE